MKSFFKAIILSIVGAFFLSACGYTQENVRVKDVYIGKKLHLYNRLLKEDKDLLNRYMVRKTFSFKVVKNGKVIYEQKEFEVDKNLDTNGNLVVVNEDSYIGYSKEINGTTIFTRSILPGSQAVNDIFKNMTIAEAIAEQKKFENIQESRRLKEIENNRKMESDLSSAIDMSLVKYHKSENDNILNITIEFKNKSNKDIKMFRGIIEIKDNFGTLLNTYLITQDEEMSADSIHVYNGKLLLDMKNKKEYDLWNMPLNKIIINFIPTDIKFSDGIFLNSFSIIKSSDNK